RHDPDFHDLIATSLTLQGGGSLSAQAEFLPALRSRGDADGRRTVQCGDFNPCAKRCFRKTDGNRAQNLVTGPGEKRVALHLDLNVEVSRRSPESPRSTFSG